jgi:hypothetical protein
MTSTALPAFTDPMKPPLTVDQKALILARGKLECVNQMLGTLDSTRLDPTTKLKNMARYFVIPSVQETLTTHRNKISNTFVQALRDIFVATFGIKTTGHQFIKNVKTAVGEETMREACQQFKKDFDKAASRDNVRMGPGLKEDDTGHKPR